MEFVVLVKARSKLRYVGLGSRSFGDRPMPCHQRVNWELFAVVRGKLAPDLSVGSTAIPAFASSSLWLFPPEVAHGWRGERGQPAEVVVLHFSTVPNLLRQLAAERGFLCVRLKAAERSQLGRMGSRLLAHYTNPTLLSEIYAERELLDLSLLFLSKRKDPGKGSLAGVNLSRVLAAETWLKENLSYNPSIRGAAKATGLSPSQLRRLFRKVRRSSPLQLLRTFRFDRAMKLMAESDVKLARVAAEGGFSSATNFCRAFMAYNGKSPNAWRREIYIKYKKPTKGDGGDHTRHGERKREL